MKPITHRLLLRQLRKVGLDIQSLPTNGDTWVAFLQRVEQAYCEADEERYTLERSLRISSEEMTELYEASRADALQLLQKEREKLGFVLSALAEGVVVLDERSQIELLNPAAEIIFGSQLQKVRGQRFGRTFGVPGWDTALDDILASKIAQIFETRITRADGSIFPAEVKFAPLNSAGGKYLGSVLTVENTTTKKQAEKALHSARDEALTASQHKSNYLAEMSHEIRTPLNSILSLVQLLSYTELDEEQQADLETLESCVHALRRMINDVLDLAKIESGKLTLNPHAFALRASVQAVTSQFRGALREKQIESHLFIDENIPDALYGDSARLGQIIMNLVSNAVKFTPEKGKISVCLSLASQTGNKCEILMRIQDSGPGIPKEKQESIFEAFDQGDEAVYGKHGGTGLGLFICSQLVSLMSGEITVTSEEGKGSCFVVRIPLSQSLTSSPRETNTELTEFIRPKENKSSVRILLVEDNEINQDTISRLLTHQGYQVSLAQNGAEAVEAIELQTFDIVLMDLHMPKMDGFEATKQIRSSNSSLSNIPIVALTAHAVQGVSESCFAAGMNGYMTKPINYPELFRIVDRLTVKP